MCPCHGGAYYEDGSRASGPPERGLFEYEHKIEANKLMIKVGDMPTLANQTGVAVPLTKIVGADSADASGEAGTTKRRCGSCQG